MFKKLSRACYTSISALRIGRSFVGFFFFASLVARTRLSSIECYVMHSHACCHIFPLFKNKQQKIYKLYKPKQLEASKYVLRPKHSPESVSANEQFFQIWYPSQVLPASIQRALGETLGLAWVVRTYCEPPIRSMAPSLQWVRIFRVLRLVVMVLLSSLGAFVFF